MKKFFLRISRFSDFGWKSYALPDGAEWREYSSLDEMIEAGATQRDGLCGIPWDKPYVDDEDIVIPAGHPMRCDDSQDDITCEILTKDGYFVRVYVGEEIQIIQDGVIFSPGCTEEEAEEIAAEWSCCDFLPEEIVERHGLLDVRFDHICPWDEYAWNLREGGPSCMLF